MNNLEPIRLKILKFLLDVQTGNEHVKDIHGLGANGLEIFNRLDSNLTANQFKAQLDYLEDKSLIRKKPDRTPPTTNKEDELKLSFYKITALGTDMIELEQNVPFNRENFLSKSSTDPELDVFISHSSEDAKFTEKLIELLRLSFNIPSQKIRCSSVDGYRLPVGTNTDEELRKEVYDAKILIGVITPSSMKSAYVLFELGARWGATKKMFPILACGANASILGGPLKSINSLDCGNVSQVHQLIDEMSHVLKIEKQSTASYQIKIDQLIQVNNELKLLTIPTKSQVDLIFKEGVYWKKDGEKIDGPYCQLCWDRDQKLLRLANEKVYDGEKDVEHKFCRSCKSNY